MLRIAAWIPILKREKNVIKREKNVHPVSESNSRCTKTRAESFQKPNNNIQYTIVRKNPIQYNIQ